MLLLVVPIFGVEEVRMEDVKGWWGRVEEREGWEAVDLTRGKDDGFLNESSSPLDCFWADYNNTYTHVKEGLIQLYDNYRCVCTTVQTSLNMHNTFESFLDV